MKRFVVESKTSYVTWAKPQLKVPRNSRKFLADWHGTESASVVVLNATLMYSRAFLSFLI